MVGFTALSQSLDPETLQLVILRLRGSLRQLHSSIRGIRLHLPRRWSRRLLWISAGARGRGGARHSGGARHPRGHYFASAARSLQLQVRVGIATGIVVVSRGERNAVGDTINLASRLQTIAEPGSLIISERTRRLAGGEFVYQDLELKEMKGVSGLPRVYRVVGVSEAESRFEAATQRGLTMMVGRRGRDWCNSRRVTWGKGNRRRPRRRSSRRSWNRREREIVNTLRESNEIGSVRTLFFQCSPFFVNSAFYPVRASIERAARRTRRRRGFASRQA